jgi:rsbT co-antagonist protein RsbR
MSERQLRPSKDDLVRQIAGALKRQAKTNRGTFAPFHIPDTAQALAAGILEHEDPDAIAAARLLGTTLGKQGLGLSALLEAQTAALELVGAAEGPDSVAVRQVSRYFGHVIESLVAADAAELTRQRIDMERAYIKATNEQREQEAILRSTISELSTPIIPVYDGILVLPLVGSIDSRRAGEITERLLEAVTAYHAQMVIIDITGVPLIDTRTAHHLLMTTRAAALLGSRVILVGIGPEIAQTIVQIGIELPGLITLANLQAGIAYALERRGLGIQPLIGRTRGAM